MLNETCFLTSNLRNVFLTAMNMVSGDRFDTFIEAAHV